MTCTAKLGKSPSEASSLQFSGGTAWHSELTKCTGHVKKRAEMLGQLKLFRCGMSADLTKVGSASHAAPRPAEERSSVGLHDLAGLGNQADSESGAALHASMRTPHGWQADGSRHFAMAAIR